MKKQRFVFLIGSLKKGGAERNLSRVASALSARGHAVHLILFEKKIEYPLDAGVQIIDLALSQYKNKLVKLFMIYWRVTSTVWSIRPRYALSFTRLGGQFLASTLYPRVITRYDAYPFFFKKRKWITSMIMFNLPNVRKVICPSSELRRHVRKYYVRKSKLHLLYNPVPDVASSTLDTPVATSRPYFVVVGRLHPQKRIEVILEAFAGSVARASYDVMILGDGYDEARLRKRAEELGLQDRVIFKGFLADPYPMMRHARALLSASSKEGFPNVLVESLFLEVPVLAADCLTGPSEIIVDGVNGYLFPVGDAATLRKQIDLLVTDEALYQTLRQQAKGSVAKFDQDLILNQWMEVLA
ncbi:glycosyltransferase [Fulvivirgaceae bacterium PWU5]|uniref:Glycosyltransferase n=1 Tax=Dawidia cretensis TaxID=2782350 RepID=A0AAP2GVU7_9BACT|nr:glycosyltransferase [Dawidia cretensis]MBT1709587.1 glycosyltransferase [Dawidia cretensis]